MVTGPATTMKIEKAMEIATAIAEKSRALNTAGLLSVLHLFEFFYVGFK